MSEPTSLVPSSLQFRGCRAAAGAKLNAESGSGFQTRGFYGPHEPRKAAGRKADEFGWIASITSKPSSFASLT